MENKFQYKQKISDVPKGERPRERLIKLGPDALSSSELLSITLTIGSLKEKETVLHLSDKLLKKYDGNLKEIFSSDINELSNTIGLGNATRIRAVYELAKRIHIPEGEKIEINAPEDVFGLFNPKMKLLDKEKLFLLCLNSRNKLINNSEILLSTGSLNSSLVEPRDIFKTALSKNAVSIILIHNHPSGDPSPSDADIETTKRIINAGEMIGIELQDHIIIGDDKYVSLKEKELI